MLCLRVDNLRTSDRDESCNPVCCCRQTAQMVTAKQNPVYGRFSKGGRNEANGKFSCGSCGSSHLSLGVFSPVQILSIVQATVIHHCFCPLFL